MGRHIQSVQEGTIYLEITYDVNFRNFECFLCNNYQLIVERIPTAVKFRKKYEYFGLRYYQQNPHPLIIKCNHLLTPSPQWLCNMLTVPPCIILLSVSWSHDLTTPFLPVVLVHFATWKDSTGNPHFAKLHMIHITLLSCFQVKTLWIITVPLQRW